MSFITAAVANSPVGSYPVTPSGLTSNNYTITFDNGFLSITPAALTVTTVNVTKTYGDNNPAFTVNYAGFISGDSPSDLGGSLSFNTAAVTNSPVGSYPVTPSGLTSNNYTITFDNGSLSVTPASLTVTTVNTSKTYGDNNPAFTVNYAGFISGTRPATWAAACRSTAPPWPTVPSVRTRSRRAA